MTEHQLQGELAAAVPQEVEKVAGTIRRQMPEDRYPYLDEMFREHALKPGYDYAKEFEFGLDLILDGLERYPR